MQITLYAMFKEIKARIRDYQKWPGKYEQEAMRNEKNIVKIKNSDGWTKMQTTIWEKIHARIKIWNIQ